MSAASSAAAPPEAIEPLVGILSDEIDHPPLAR